MKAYTQISSTAHLQEGLLVVAKRAGMSIHNHPGNDLVSILKKDFLQYTPTPCHRLDKGTSGLVIFGLDSQTVSHVGSLVQQGKIDKTYLAVVKGIPTQKRGCWNYSLSNKAESRNNPRGKGAHRIHCRTDYEVIATGENSALLKIALHTGRQHQIRRHAAIGSFPIIGDTRYGTIRSSRLCLHAVKVSFRMNNTDYSFTSWPESDFWDLWRGEPVPCIF